MYAASGQASVGIDDVPSPCAWTVKVGGAQPVEYRSKSALTGPSQTYGERPGRSVLLAQAGELTGDAGVREPLKGAAVHHVVVGVSCDRRDSQHAGPATNLAGPERPLGIVNVRRHPGASR
jgi:hypothetical protein